MATIKNEFDYIQEARSQLAEALVNKFGVREQDILNADGSIKSTGLWASNSDGSKNYLKRLHDWAVLVTATNVHTDASLTFKNDGSGDAAGTTFDGSVARSISYNSIGAAPVGHTHTTKIETSTNTSLIALAYGGKYKLTAGGATYIFTMPSSDNTWRPIGTGANDAAAGNHVHKNLIIKWGTRNTEGTNLFTYNGSTAKTIDLSTPFSLLFTNFDNTDTGYKSTDITATIGGTTKSFTVNWATYSALAQYADEWNAARLFTIGSTGKYVDGSKNVSWTLAEIGASASSHTHSVQINGNTKTIAAPGGAAVDLGSYLPLTGGTMTGQIVGNNKGGNWIAGRTNAAIYQSRSTNDWHPVIGFKTNTGSWEFGSSTSNDSAVFSWGSDSNYNSGYDATTTVNLRNISGTIALTSEIPTVTNYYWANVPISATSSTATNPTFGSVVSNGLITAKSGIQIGSTPNIGWYECDYHICAGGVEDVARRVNVGSLLVSDDWSDSSKVPTNGIHSKGNIKTSGKVTAVDSLETNGAIYTQKFISFGANGALVNTDIRNAWGTALYGNTTLSSRLITVYTNVTIDDFSEIYGSGLAWASGASHGYLSVSRTSGKAWIGGGSANKLNWSTYLVTGNNIGSQSVNYATSAGDADTIDGYHASLFSLASHTHNYLPLSGGTMTGPIITPGDDSVVLKPARDSFDSIGSEDEKFWKIYSSYFYGDFMGTASNANKFDNTFKSKFVYANGDFGTSDVTNSSSLTRTQFWRDSTRGRIGVFVSHYSDSRYGWEISAPYSNDGNFTGRIKEENSWGNEYTFLTDSNWRLFITSSASREFWINGYDSSTVSTSCPVIVMNWTNREYSDLWYDGSFHFGNHASYNNGADLHATNYYTDSDIRYKNVIKHSCVDLPSLATLPLFLYTWNDNRDNIIHIGSSAQAVELVIPLLVTEDSTGFKSLNYSILGTVAGITACKELVIQKSEIEQLRERVIELEKQLNEYRGISLGN